MHSIKLKAKGLSSDANGGAFHACMTANVPCCLEQVWHNPQSLANVLSLASACRHCRVTFDSHQDNAFVMHTKDGPQRFKLVTGNKYACAPNPPTTTASPLPSGAADKAKPGTKTVNKAKPMMTEPTNMSKATSIHALKATEPIATITKTKPMKAMSSVTFGMVFVETAEERASCCTTRQRAQATLARELLHAVDYSVIQNLKCILKMNTIENCQVTE